MNETLRAVLGELRREYTAIYGDRLTDLLLFGSQARGEARPGSDIDVLVVLQGPVEPAEEIERCGGVNAALSLKYEVVIACVYVSTAHFANEQSPLFINVRREGVAV